MVSKIVHKSEGHALSVFAGFVPWCGCGCILTWSGNTVLPPSSQRGKYERDGNIELGLVMLQHLLRRH